MSSRYGRVILIAWRVVLAAVGLFSTLLLLWETNVIPWPERTFTLRKIRANEGFGFSSKMPAPWPGFEFVPQSGVLTENGRTLTPVKENGIVREQGMGTFRVGREKVLFSTSDGSDPLKNERSYSLCLRTVVIPAFRLPILYAGGFALLLLLWKKLFALFAQLRRSAMESTSAGPALSARVLALGLFAIALAIRLGFLWLHPDYTDGQMSIRGTPYSDARDWQGMAKSTAEGRGVDSTYPGMRALYPMFLANFYTWFGNSVPLAKSLQAMIGAASTALIFLLLRRAMPLWAALAAAVFFAVDPRQVTQTGKLMTEPFGLLLVMLSAWCTIVGGERRRIGMLFAAGAFFACSNLARPLTLFAFPIFIALIAVNGWLRESGRWRAAFLHSAAFAIGTFVFLAPWIIRERVVHGIWAISCNSSSALFAASTPEFGVWKSGVEQLAAKSGVPRKVKARYDYFQARFRENLQKYPGFYAANIVRSFRAATTSAENDLPHLRLAGFGVVAMLFGVGWLHGGFRRAAFLAVPAFFAACALFWAGNLILAALTIVGIAFTIWWRVFPGLVLLTSHFGGLLGSALFGNPDLQRVRLLIDWIEAGWTFAGAFAVANVAMTLIARIPFPALLASDRGVTDEAPAAWLRVVGWAFAGFIVISSCRLVYRNAIHPTPRVPIRILDAARVSVLHEFARHFPLWLPLTNPALMSQKHGWERLVFAEFGTIENEVYYFRTNDGLKHWSGLFDARPYAHTTGIFRVIGGPFTGNIWFDYPGEVPAALRESPSLIVGLTRVRPNAAAYMENSVEAVAIIPAPDFKPDFTRAIVATIVPETQALLDASTSSGIGSKN